MRAGQLNPEALAAISKAPGVKDKERDLAEQIRKEAKRLAPKRTGNLRRNIIVEVVHGPKTDTDEYRIGWNRKAWYGRLVELGTEDTPAQPHLRPAADKFKNH